ncbi:MAG: hypothetical protein H6833_01935 [Planctomycetes bacterium]|nr:hypothetical protein [Planctomycetota bacterium]
MRDLRCQRDYARKEKLVDRIDPMQPPVPRTEVLRKLDGDWYAFYGNGVLAHELALWR